MAALLCSRPIPSVVGRVSWSEDSGGRPPGAGGIYTVTPGQINPNSHSYLSFNIGYPNAFDRAYGRTGGDIIVHGDCSSRGCYARLTSKFQRSMRWPVNRSQAISNGFRCRLIRSE